MFSAADGVHGLEFWASDGWSAARLVNDIAVGAGSSEPNLFTAVGPLVFFGANDNRTGGELWAITRAALHRAFNLPDSINDVEAEQESSPGRFNRTDGCSDDLLCAEFMEDDAGRDNVYKEGI
jgi:ELWxxDGT repeat protein